MLLLFYLKTGMFKKPEINFPELATAPSRPTRSVILFGEVLIDAFPDRLVLGGAPFNVARHLRAFGLNPILISRTGNDEYRNILLAAMAGFGMETMGVQCDPTHPTGQVQVHVDKDGHRFEILPEQAYDFIHPAITRMVTLSAQADLVYFGTLAQRNKTSRRALGTLLRSNAAPRMLDINLRKPWYDVATLKRSLAHADIVKVNEEELVTLAGLLRLQVADERAAAEMLIRQYDLECLLVTYGEMGAWLLNKDGTEVDIEGIAGQSVADTVGAGDAFSAVFITGALSGWPVRKTLMRANAFAAALCSQHGAIPETADFYSPFLVEWGLEQEPQTQLRGRQGTAA
jgi:fructokinase